MNIRKTLITGMALAIAIAFSPPPALRAATLLGPSSQPAAESLAQPVKMKRKGKVRRAVHRMVEKVKGHRRHARRGMARSHGSKCSGTYMYHKKGKCMDARNK